MTSLSVYSPHDGKLLHKLPMADRTDVDDAYANAVAAQQEWAERGPRERAAVIDSLLHTIESRWDEIVSELIAEAGSSEQKANAELEAATGIIEQARGYPGRVSGSIEESNIEGKINHVHRVPKGVVTAITAWNFPFHLASRVTAPALAVGNAVVLKPAPETPYVGGKLFADICAEAGVPDGLVNVVIGDKSEIGDHLTTHPDSNLVAFTGSTEVGKHVGKCAVENLSFPALELGGNSPQIVLDDADVESAARVGAEGSFFHAGQICTAINRHIVHEDVVDKYVNVLIEEARDWEVSPLINETQRNRLNEFVKSTVDAGSTLEIGGEYEGLFYEPTVLTGVRNEMPLACNEQFGPVAAIITVENELEALKLANDVDRGLSASVWSENERRAIQLGRQIDTGMVHINDHTVGNEGHVPFGGMKHSGIGRYNDEPFIFELTESQCLAIQR